MAECGNADVVVEVAGVDNDDHGVDAGNDDGDGDADADGIDACVILVMLVLMLVPRITITIRRACWMMDGG